MEEDKLITPISPAVAVQALRERINDCDIKDVTYLGGSFHSAFSVNNTYIFKFPKFEEIFDHSEKHFHFEGQLLPVIRKNVWPHEISVQTHHLPDPSTSFAGPIFGYRFFSGKQLSKLQINPDQEDLLAVLIGDFLSKLHTTSIEMVKNLQPSNEVEMDLRRLLFEDYEEDIKIVFPLLSNNEREWIENLYNNFLQHNPGAKYTMMLKHGEFCPENVLWPLNREFLQVIDFEKVGIGSAMEDFCEWIGFLGNSFVSKILNHYTATEISMEAIQFYYGRKPLIYFRDGMLLRNKNIIDFGRAWLNKIIIESKIW